ncbi:MAG: hypothetical protein HFG33_01705 [Bacilli bacterium]|nr:hypothetical protein [Bacilli bacterium]
MEKKDNGYILPTLGALVGGLVATLPWILSYVYAETMWSILAIFIAIVALKGYQLLHGKVDKKLPFIILAVSLISITIATLVIIPNLLVIKEYGKFSLDMFKALYEYDEFKRALMGDYVISLVFTILGTSGVISSIKRDISNGKTEVSWNSPVYVPTEEEIAEVKKMFVDRNALDKNTTIARLEVNDHFKDKKAVLDHLKRVGMLKSSKGGLYFSLDDEKNPNKAGNKKLAIIVGVSLFVIIAACIGIALIPDSESKDKDTGVTEDKKKQETVKRDEISYDLVSGFTDFLEEKGDTTYIAVPKKDQTGTSGYVSISYYEMDKDTSFEEINKSLKKEFKKLDEYKSEEDVEINKSYKTRLYTFEYEEYDEKFYYFQNGQKYAFVDCIIYEDDSAGVENACKTILNTLKWNE